VIHSDGWRGYNGLVDVGYSKHLPVNHTDAVFAIGDIHIRGTKAQIFTLSNLLSTKSVNFHAFLMIFTRNSLFLAFIAYNTRIQSVLYAISSKYQPYLMQ